MARQQDLPGMTDRKLKDLHDACLDYVEKRDARMEMLKVEVDLKDKIKKLLKKHKMEHYEYDGVIADLVVEEETVKVRAPKKKLEEEAA